MKRLSILALLLMVGVADAACPSGQWTAAYFNNKTLTGTPVFNNCEAVIDNSWGSGGPGNSVTNDNFSARWTGTFAFSNSTVTFTAVTDDGMRVWLDNDLVIDSWKDQAPTTYTANRVVIAGNHDIKVEYYENGGGAVAKLSWVSTGPPSTWSPKLTWTDNSTTETEFRIERCAGVACSSFIQVGTVGANVTMFTDTVTGPVGTWYCWRARAANTTTVSGYSNTVCASSPVTTNPPDGTPLSVNVTVTVPPIVP